MVDVFRVIGFYIRCCFSARGERLVAVARVSFSCAFLIQTRHVLGIAGAFVEIIPAEQAGIYFKIEISASFLVA